MIWPLMSRTLAAGESLGRSCNRRSDGLEVASTSSERGVLALLRAPSS